VSNGAVRVGIVANEYFDPAVGRIGGFGWAGRSAIEALRTDRGFAEPIFFSGEMLATPERRHIIAGGTRVVLRHQRRRDNFLAACRDRVDVLLCIDYRPNYLPWLLAMARKPAIIWVRDPRTSVMTERVRSLRIPGSDVPPGGIPEWDMKSLARFVHKTRWFRAPVLLANKMAYMRALIDDTFGMPPSEVELPNPDVIDYCVQPGLKSERPSVAYLGRFDPVKRPWLYIELARWFPDVDFAMLGAPFVAGNGGWTPGDVPPNLRFLGNVTGREKLDALSAAWVLVNTSIHEHSAVSMLEALACETPIISFIEADGITGRFGTCLGYERGTGLDALPRLEQALGDMLRQHERRHSLGRDGRRWVMEEHNTRNFLSMFRAICTGFGITVHCDQA
jgi:glycosyltransferase involved in cell wall biosynthesis